MCVAFQPRVHPQVLHLGGGTARCLLRHRHRVARSRPPLGYSPADWAANMHGVWIYCVWCLAGATLIRLSPDQQALQALNLLAIITYDADDGR